MIDQYRFDHVLGLNKRRIGKISNLPINMTKQSQIFEHADKVTKLPQGPTMLPKPGPTLEKHVSEEVNAVIKSAHGSSDKRSVERMTIKTASKKKLCTPLSVSSDRLRLFSLTE